ncbi:MAG TPA: hypothetical protein VGB73_14750 [Pyrinomonadaceae bacterium]|jgi:hypothetical protein
MKIRVPSGLLALALLVGLVLACSGGGGNENNATNNNNAGNNNASNVNNSNGASSTTNNSNGSTSSVTIDDMYMAKDAGGKYGDKTEDFKPSDRTVYVVAELSGSQAGTKVKFVWTAVDVAGAEKGEQIKDIEYTTGALENKINAHLTLPQDWPKGTYKVDAYVNGNLNKSVEYSVE